MGWRNRKQKSPEPDRTVSRLRILESPRMTLVAATVDLVSSDIEGRASLAEMLEANVPDNWPPDLYDIEPLKFALRQLAERSEQGWSFWYLLTEIQGRNYAIGICGFKGRPDASGSAEIGYSVLSQFRNQGFASEAVQRLLTWAFSHQSVNEVAAETLPHLQQSISVMKKNGFEFSGPGSEMGVVRYIVKRPDGR
jgi:ribosomal-protein-alanine N-acetyltransferase